MIARYQVVWTDAAASDYESLLTYVTLQSGVRRAIALDQKLQRAIDSLGAIPLRCRIVPELRLEGLDVYREFIVRPYRLMFRIRGRDLVLLAVVDGRRDLQELLVERALMA
ncbi:MAG: type II toxin-antitoxin system RelE/ParE family toxin [Myxococcales bacterium]|nr:type II toxin-antitoxin system RelE/ParE family toxin [Myxococcales bacterium]